MSSSQVLMWWTGSSTMLKGSQIAVKHESMPATCWKLATFDTLSTRSLFLNSATMSLETSVAVSRKFWVKKNLLAIKTNFKVMFPVTFTVNCWVFWLVFSYVTNVVQKYSQIWFFLFLSDMTHLSLHDHDGSSGGASDQDTVPPLPHPGAAPWPMALPYQFPIPHPYDLPQPFHGGPGAGSAGSQHSGESTFATCAHQKHI